MVEQALEIEQTQVDATQVSQAFELDGSEEALLEEFGVLSNWEYNSMA